MLVLSDFSPQEPVPRAHPWGKTGYAEGGGAYYDFRSNPHLIRSVLEDFIPYASQPAVERFYQLLEMLNGPDSSLETNDCALSGPHEPAPSIFRGTVGIGGRLEFFYRSLERNLSREAVSWLVFLFEIYAQRAMPDMLQGVLCLKMVETEFLRAASENQSGHRVRVTFNVYSNSELEAWETLSTMFTGLLEVFKRVEKAHHEKLPEFP